MPPPGGTTWSPRSPPRWRSSSAPRWGSPRGGGTRPCSPSPRGSSPASVRSAPRGEAREVWAVHLLPFRADGVSAPVFQLETKVKAAQALEQELAEAQRALQQAPTVEGLGLIPD